MSGVTIAVYALPIKRPTSLRLQVFQLANDVAEHFDVLGDRRHRVTAIRSLPVMTADARAGAVRFTSAHEPRCENHNSDGRHEASGHERACSRKASASGHEQRDGADCVY